MEEYQFERLIAWLFYSIGLWIFCRYWYGNFFQKREPIQIENIVPPSISAERFKRERLMTENQKLNTEIEKLKISNEQMKAEVVQLKSDLENWKKLARRELETINSLKAQNDTLSEALNKANKQQKSNLERETVPAMTKKHENGVIDEFDAMVQVMKGRPLAVNTIQKTQSTEIYNKLIDKIEGAKQQVETALNDTKQPDCVNDWKNFDINKYMPV